MKIPVKDNIYVQLDKGNLRGFTLFTNSENIVLRRGDHGEITTIIIEDLYRIKIKDVVEIQGIRYTVNKIRQGNEKYFYIIQERATKTSQFIMPILGHNYEYYDFRDNFFNSYLSSDYHSIYLVYKFSPSEEYLQLEEKLQAHSNFLEMLDPDPNTVVFKFSLDERYWRDIDYIMKGKYSRISSTLKSKICIFHKFGTTSKTYKVLYRDKTLREEISKEYGFEIPSNIDLMSKPLKELEIWNLVNSSSLCGMKN